VQQFTPCALPQGWAYAWTGAGMARHFLQYAVTDICLNSWTAQVLNSSVCAMVIKQGIEVCKVCPKKVQAVR
jgi:hypothetical protein